MRRAAVLGALALLAGCGGTVAPPPPPPATRPPAATSAARTATRPASGAGGSIATRSPATAPRPLVRTPAPVAPSVSRTARRGAAGVSTTAPPAADPSAAAAPLPQSYAFTGVGDRALGAIRLSGPSVLRWSARPGARFALSGDGPGGRPLAISSAAAGGQLRLAGGELRGVSVRTSGRWTIVIVATG